MGEITLARTHDMALVAETLAHPAIWPHIHEDGTELPELEDAEAMHWLHVSDGEHGGFFLVHPKGVACWEVHTCLLPRMWGPGAIKAVRLMFAYLFETVGARKAITNVPAYNRAALRFAKASGMQVEGTNRASYLRNGHMEDQIMLGITYKEWKCQQFQH